MRESKKCQLPLKANKQKQTKQNKKKPHEKFYKLR